ncbi:hypothetical protein B296_00021718 [Ensete ventricosum]|uniref:Purple acid phosphatase C-terminal domain-containing protein n=1 Tax=Ensete ventricosum TaxID=4639 RepID=A0A426ZNP4_ENSVE|nr:hypothetical protein B296_00021718 [Ensete ventricosum]
MFKRCDKIVIFQMTVTWTSGYGINEAEPFVEWGARGDSQVRSPAGTLTFSRNSMCGLTPRACSFLLQNACIRNGSNYYSGPFEATTHVVVGGGGASLADFTTVRARWSYYQDHDYGFAKLTAFNHSMLLLEYKRSSDGRVYDHFIIARDYRDVLSCAVDSCSRTTLAS